MSVLAASLTSCRKMAGRCCSLFWPGNRPPVRAALADRTFPQIYGPGEKAHKIIFVWEDVVRYQFLPHVQSRPVASAIAKVPGAISFCQIFAYFLSLFAHGEERALFRKNAVGHADSPCVVPGRLSGRADANFWYFTRGERKNIWGEVGKPGWGMVCIIPGNQVMPRTLSGLILQRFADS